MNKCGAKNRAGNPCGQRAGWGTDHVGDGRCKLHGGNAGRPIIHGRYSIKHRESLQAKMQEFLEDENPGNLMSELALQRAMLQDFLERLGTEIPINVVMRKHVFDMVESISKVIERVTRILNQSALTIAEVKLLEMTILDLLLRYIDDPQKRLSFMGEFRRLVGSTHRTDRGQASSGLSDQD